MRPGLIRKLTELLNFQDKVYRRDRFLQTEKGAEIDTLQKEEQHMAEERKDICMLTAGALPICTELKDTGLEY